MFLVNSRSHLVTATPFRSGREGLHVHRGVPSPEVTVPFCLVPSPEFSQAPWDTHPVHLCRFGVRSIRWGYFLELPGQPCKPSRKTDFRNPSLTSRFRNINLIPIDYAFRLCLRGRLTLRRLTLRRNPWTFGEGASHPLYRYSCQHSHF